MGSSRAACCWLALLLGTLAVSGTATASLSQDESSGGGARHLNGILGGSNAAPAPEPMTEGSRSITDKVKDGVKDSIPGASTADNINKLKDTVGRKLLQLGMGDGAPMPAPEPMSEGSTSINDKIKNEVKDRVPGASTADNINHLKDTVGRKLLLLGLRDGEPAPAPEPMAEGSKSITDKVKDDVRDRIPGASTAEKIKDTVGRRMLATGTQHILAALSPAPDMENNKKNNNVLNKIKNGFDSLSGPDEALNPDR